MNPMIDIGYILALFISVAAFAVHLTVKLKQVDTKNLMDRGRSVTLFLLAALTLNICDFLVVYFQGMLAEKTVSWIFAVENVLEVVICYTVLSMGRELAGMENPKWMGPVFLGVSAVIFYCDSIYSYGGMFAEETQYVTAMIVLNSVPILLLAVFGIRYWRIYGRESSSLFTRRYMLLYNIIAVLFCIIGTVSMIDSRTARDFVFYDRELYAAFWMIFNILNLIYVWRTSFPQIGAEGSEPRISQEEHWEQLVLQYGLSSREKEIGELLYQGKNNKEIAELLFLSPNTVKVHASNLYKKLGASNRVQAVQILSGETIYQPAAEGSGLDE